MLLYNRRMKISKNFRLSTEACSLLEKLADDNGISQTAMIEILIRDRAKSRITFHAPTKKEKP